MEVTDLLPESSNEARSSTDELDDHGSQSVDTDQRISPQEHSQNDAASEPSAESIPSVPSSSSRDVGAVPTAVHQANTDGDSDVFMYLALGATILVFAAVLYKHVVK